MIFFLVSKQYLAHKPHYNIKEW